MTSEVMTKEEASKIIKRWLANGRDGLTKDRLGYIEGWFHNKDSTAFKMAIDALNQEPILNNISDKIETKYNSVPWRNNDYDDGFIAALEWVRDVIDDCKKERNKYE